ncbi:MAG: DUF928 domain-containing protein [Cyanothece sp. SIO1E1]|nr:DUF928 domain-containing protein [Cyanothece sp. SIO1E1]
MMQQRRISGRMVIQGAIATLLVVFTATLASSNQAEQATGAAATRDTAPLTFKSSGGFDSQGRPRSRTSGGSRGNCTDQLIALLPGTDTLVTTEQGCSAQSTSVLALTLSAHPVFWFHVPEQDQVVAAESSVTG